jgi:hypothetical protein
MSSRRRLCSSADRSGRCWIGAMRNAGPVNCIAANPAPCADVSCGCNFHWPDNSSLVAYTAWQPGYPLYGSGVCVRTGINGWNEASCSATYFGICQGTLLA